MSMSTRQRCLALAKALDADLRENTVRSGLDVDVWSPPGKVWYTTDCHALVSHDLTDRAAGWTFLLDELEKGLRPCDQEMCETCYPRYAVPPSIAPLVAKFDDVHIDPQGDPNVDTSWTIFAVPAGVVERTVKRLGGLPYPWNGPTT